MEDVDEADEEELFTVCVSFVDLVELVITEDVLLLFVTFVEDEFAIYVELELITWNVLAICCGKTNSLIFAIKKDIMILHPNAPKNNSTTYFKPW